MQAREIMTPRPFAADVSTPVHDVLQTLEDEDIRHVPVLEGGELVGVVSDRDLRRFSREAWRLDPESARLRLRTPVSAVMSSDVVHVDADTDIDDVIDLMLEHRIGAVPVVDGAEGDLVGIVSYVDVLRAARGRL